MTKDSATKIWGYSLSSEAVKSFAPSPFLYAASDLCVCACPKRVVNKNSSWDMENISHELDLLELSQLGEDFAQQF